MHFWIIIEKKNNNNNKKKNNKKQKKNKKKKTTTTTISYQVSVIKFTQLQMYILYYKNLFAQHWDLIRIMLKMYL